jgi:hypothetical protein
VPGTAIAGRVLETTAAFAAEAATRFRLKPFVRPPSRRPGKTSSAPTSTCSPVGLFAIAFLCSHQHEAEDATRWGEAVILGVAGCSVIGALTWIATFPVSVVI